MQMPAKERKDHEKELRKIQLKCQLDISRRCFYKNINGSVLLLKLDIDFEFKPS